MNIAIVDDGHGGAENIAALLKEYSLVSGIIIGTDRFSEADELLKIYRPLLYTAVFIDTDPEGTTGLQTAQKIREIDFSVLLVFAAPDEGALAGAMRCHAFDYLLKPVSREELFRAMTDIVRMKARTDRQIFIFSVGRREHVLPYDGIVYIRTESTGSNYIEVADVTGAVYRTRMTFSAAYSALAEDKRFLRLRTGMIANMEHIAAMEDKCFVMDNGEKLAFAVKKERELRRIWQNYKLDSVHHIKRTEPGGG